MSPITNTKKAPTPVKRAAPKAAAPASSGTAFMSFLPDTFTAGGLLDDVDVTITDALTCEFDYNGQQAASPALAIEFTDVNEAAHIQYYTAGKLEDWKPDADGDHFVAVSGKAGLNRSTNLAMFIDSLIKAGASNDLLAQMNESVKALVGLKAHVLQTAQERKGLIRTGANKDRPSTVLLITKVLAWPDGTGAAPVATGKSAAAVSGKSNGAAKAEPAAASGEPSEVDSLIINAISEALAGGEPIAKKAIAKIAFDACAGAVADKSMTAVQRNQVVVRANNQEFLKGLADYGIAYDGASVSMATEQ